MIPTPYTILQHRSIITGRDEYNDPVYGFGVDVERQVYGWVVQSSTEEGVTGGRTVRVLQVLAPTFPADPKDEFTVPGHGRLSQHAVAVDYDHGPFGHTFGMVLTLKLTEG